MVLRIIINIALIIILAVAQVSFISGFNGWLDNLNLLLIILIFILGFAGLDSALYWAVGAGFILEIFSFLPFGVYLISLALTIAAASLLLNYLFTNRSLYSFLMLAAITTAIYNFIIYAFIFFFNGVDKLEPLSGSRILISFSEQIGLNLLATAIIFYIIHLLIKNFRPMFLMKGKL